MLYKRERTSKTSGSPMIKLTHKFSNIAGYVKKFKTEVGGQSHETNMAKRH